MPISRNQPTYDSAHVANGKDLGVELLQADKISLLLQMTVSGATRLLRRPDHEKTDSAKIENEFKHRVVAFERNGMAYTAFFVPAERFKPFLFQCEEVVKGKKADYQPELQSVCEVPDIFVYNKRTVSQRIFINKPIFHCFLEEKSRSY